MAAPYIPGSNANSTYSQTPKKTPPKVIPSAAKGHTNPGSRGGQAKLSPAVVAARKAASARGQGVHTGTTTNTTTTGTTPVPGVNTLTAPTPEDAVLNTSTLPTAPGYGQAGTGGTDLASKFDPMAYAQGAAGQQYDPQITQMAQRIKGIVQALPGSLDSLHKAFSNLDARAAAPPVQGVIGGGDAASQQYQAAMVNTGNQASANQAAGAASREADWAQRIKLLSGANVEDLRGQLSGLQGQKADAVQQYYGQGIKTKSDLVSQAISNINSIRASNDAQAMVQGNLTGQGLKNQAQQLANSGAAASLAYLPYQEQQALTQGNQQITQGNQTIQSNDLSITQAKNTLKTTVSGQKNLNNALSSGGPQATAALTSLVIPQGGLVQTATGYTHVNGDPNIWAKNGVAQIMRTLPKSNRTNVVKYVDSIISSAVSPAGGWTKNKNGKWVRPK